jgi:hypothetical protein
MQLEMKKLMDEDALFMQKRIPGDYDYDVVNFQRSRPPLSVSRIDSPYHHDDHDEEACCDVCAAEKHKDSCVCDVCSMKKIGIFEGCGCDDMSYENPYTMEREEDYDLNYHDENHMINNALQSLTDLGGNVDVDFNHDDHKHSSYMARPQLYKISKYASKLLDMVDEHEELEDWQESKIAQIAQMIGSVYHSLDYDEEYEEDDNILMSHLV